MWWDATPTGTSSCSSIICSPTSNERCVRGRRARPAAPLLLHRAHHRRAAPCLWAGALAGAGQGAERQALHRMPRRPAPLPAPLRRSGPSPATGRRDRPLTRSTGRRSSSDPAPVCRANTPRGIESGAMPPQDLGRKSLLLLGSTWSGSALGMIVSILIGRVLGPTALGSIAFSTGLVGLLMAALLPGFSQAHLKRLSEGQDPGRCIGTMATIQLALQGILLAALAATWSRRLAFSAADLSLVFLLVLAAQVANNFADVFLKVLVAREWIVPHSIIVVAARLGRLLAALALSLRYGIVPRLPTRQSFGAYWTYARPFLVSTPLALFQDSIDRVVVGRWAGLTAAGYYQVARALWEGLSSVIAAPGIFLFTRLSGFYAQRSPARDREAREFFFGGFDKLLFITIPLAFCFWAFA